MGNEVLQGIERHISKTMDSVRPGAAIVAVYIFGSIARDHAQEESDIDVAFLLDEAAYKKDPVEAIGPVYLMATRMGMALDRESDVTILNGASLEMAYEIVTSGRCVFEADEEKRLEYEIAIRGMYFDLWNR